MDIVEQQTESLELHTNALQILLGKPHSLSEVMFPAVWFKGWQLCSGAIAYTPAHSWSLLLLPAHFAFLM